MVRLKVTPRFRRLYREIKRLSQGEYWEDIVQEWELVRVFFQEGGTCKCGYAPITEHCVLRNRLNGNKAIVGNVCVKHFLGIDTGPLFEGLKRVLDDTTKALNADAVEYARDHGWLSDWEHTFLQKTLRKRKLTPKQRAKRVEINRSIVARLTRESTHACK